MTGYKMIECPECHAFDDENIAKIFNVEYVEFEEIENNYGFGMRQMRCPACSYQFFHMDSDDGAALLFPFFAAMMNRK